MSSPVSHPYRKAFVGAAAIAVPYIVFLAFAATRQTGNGFDAEEWGYVAGSFAIPTLIGTLAAGYWTQKSAKDLSFARVAARGAAIVFCLLFFQTVGRVVEHRRTLEAKTEALATWKLKPIPVRVTWPEGWRVRPASFNDQLSGFVQGADNETPDTASFASLACIYRSTTSADRQPDEMLKGTAEGFFAKFKAQGIELVSRPIGDGSLGAYAARRLEFDNKNGAVPFHGEILKADAPDCRLVVIAYHAGKPYDSMKDVIDRFKASIR